MQLKKITAIVLVLSGFLAGYIAFGHVQRYRALRSGAVDATLECKENLIFLQGCDSLIRKTGDETEAMMKAQVGIQRTLEDRDIRSLLRAGISGKKRDSVIRILDDINIYNAELSYAFYGSAGPGRVQYPEKPLTTGEMIKEFTTLEQILEK